MTEPEIIEEAQEEDEVIEWSEVLPATLETEVDLEAELAKRSTGTDDDIADIIAIAIDGDF